MPEPAPETVVAIYRVKADRLDAFMDLLRTHHPTLLKAGLVTDERPVVYVGDEKDGGSRMPIVFEIFTWLSREGSRIAHETPEVARIWEAMGTMTEERGGRPQFEFPHVKKAEIAWEG